MYVVCVWVKFYLRQNKGCSPGDSTLDSSEKLLQRGSGGSSIYMFLVKEEFTTIKSLLYKRFSACHEELMSSRRDLVLSWTCGDARIQIMKSVPENIYLAKDLFYRFPGAQNAWVSTLNSLPGTSKVNSCRSTGFNLRKMWRQMANALGSASL